MTELTVATTGTARIGDIEPGWSVQEFATPVNPNETAGGTGAVSFSGKALNEALLVINDEVTSTVSGLGSLTGRTRNASQVGQRLSLTHDTPLNRYDVEKTMPPMICASVPSALSLAQAVLGDTGYNPPDQTGNYWSLNGHAAGYTPDGDLVTQDARTVNYQVYDTGAAAFVSHTTTTYSGVLDPSGFAVFGNKFYATGLTGDSFAIEAPPVVSDPDGAPTILPNNSFILQGKIVLNGGNFQFRMFGQPFGPVDGDYGQTITASINYAAQTMTVSVDRRTGGILDTVTNTVSIASLNRDTELAFRVYYSFNTTYQLAMSLVNTSNYSTVVTANTGTFSADLAPVWFDRWTISGNVRAIRYNPKAQDFNAAWPLASRVDWEQAQDFTFTGNIQVGDPAIGFTGVMWKWLQDACSAYRWEIAVQNNGIVARPVGTNVLDLDNVAGSPQLGLDSSFAAKRIDVNYANARIVSSAEVYDARADDNRIISVGAGQVTEITLQSNAYLTSVLPPTRTTTFIPGRGTYYVVDSTGLPVVDRQWEDYGGSLQVRLDPNSAGGILVTLRGPSIQIPSTTAPYSLAVSDGQNQYAALSIIGSGVVGEPTVLELQTGVSELISSQEVGFSITNPFISTIETALDAGVWASTDASGPKMTLTATVPTSAISALGVAAGSLVSFNNSIYRVTSVTVGRTSSALTCTRHVTVDDVDAIWGSQTVDDFDAFWSGYSLEDYKIIPLKSA